MSEFLSELVGAIFQAIAFSIIPFLWWLITARKKENFFVWLGFKKIEFSGNIIKIILITLAAVFVYGSATTIIVNKFTGEITSAGSQFAGKGAAYIPVAFIYGFIRTGLSEELLFRGFLLKRISNKFGFITGNIIQAFIFGLMHGVPFGLATQNIGITILLTALPGLLGFYMGWLNEKKCNGSIIPSWILHGITNTAVTCFSLF